MKFIFVSVGTDHHRFDRLVASVDRWFAQQDGEHVSCLIQYGYSTPPRHAQGTQFMPRDEVLSAMKAADLVIAHGGPATIMEAERQDHIPVCAPRDPQLGEHVDDHQMRFSRALAAAGRVTLVETEELLNHLLSTHISRRLDTAGGEVTEVVSPAGLPNLVAVVEDVLTRRGRW